MLLEKHLTFEMSINALSLGFPPEFRVPGSNPEKPGKIEENPGVFRSPERILFLLKTHLPLPFSLYAYLILRNVGGVADYS